MSTGAEAVAVGATASRCLKCCCNQFDQYIVEAGKNVSDLQSEVSKLRAMGGDVKNTVATRRLGKSKEVVENWLDRSAAIEEEAKKVSDNYAAMCLPRLNCWTRYRIGKRAFRKLQKTKDLIDERKSLEEALTSAPGSSTVTDGHRHVGPSPHVGDSIAPAVTIEEPVPYPAAPAVTIEEPVPYSAAPAVTIEEPVPSTMPMKHELHDKPLRKFTGAFHAISQKVGPNYPPLTTEAFADACSEMHALIRLMWDGASFILDEVAPKVEQIKRMSKYATTLEELIEQDKANNSFKAAESNSRTLFRLNRALEVVKVFFEQLLKERMYREDPFVQSAATTAYMVVFARYHAKLVQNIVIAAFSNLPNKAWLLNKINEDEDDAIIEMRKYVDASAVVIDYINEFFTDFNPW